VFFDGYQLLLADKAVPATQRLSVGGRVGVIGVHIRSHYACGVSRYIQASLKPVLQAHASSGF